MQTTATIRIECPAAEVFDYVADMANNPQWQRGQVSCVWTSEPPIGVGSTYDQEATFAGRTITSSFEVTEFEPGRRIRIVTTAGTMPIDVTREVRPAGDNACDVSAEVRGDPPWLFRLLGPLTRRMLTKSVAGDYGRLKAQLEAR